MNHHLVRSIDDGWIMALRRRRPDAPAVLVALDEADDSGRSTPIGDARLLDLAEALGFAGLSLRTGDRFSRSIESVLPGLGLGSEGPGLLVQADRGADVAHLLIFWASGPATYRLDPATIRALHLAVLKAAREARSNVR